MDSIGLFKGEHALVTGSASNIGRAIAEALAREGASVTLCDVDPVRNAATLGAIIAAGGTAEAVTTDLATRDGWKSLVEHVAGHPVHMLVHSAAPARKEADHALDVTEETWDACLSR